jgi:hypothetical protein
MCSIINMGLVELAVDAVVGVEVAVEDEKIVDAVVPFVG